MTSLMERLKRNGFTPSSREDLMIRFVVLEAKECSVANLPEKKAGRWDRWLTAAKMAACRWLKSVLVGQFKFLERTGENHPRYTEFIALR